MEAGIAVRTTGPGTTQERYLSEGSYSSPCTIKEEEAYALCSSSIELSLEFET